MSRALVLSDVNAVSDAYDIMLADAGLDPTGLFERWSARSGVYKGTGGQVAGWVGINGNIAAQPNVIGYPDWQADGAGAGKPAILFTGPDILHTTLLPTSTGYAAAAFVMPPITGTHKVLMGSYVDLTNRWYFGVTGTGQFYALIGKTNYTGGAADTLVWTTPLVAGQTYVGGASWKSDGSAELFVDNVSRDTATWNTAGATVGTLPISFGGRRTVATPTGDFKWVDGKIMAIALYSGDPSPSLIASVNADLLAMI